MPTLSEDYVTFKNSIIRSANGNQLSDVQWNSLINSFQPIINSERRSRYINTLDDLIKILEKRGFVGEGKIENFKQFDTVIPNIQSMIRQYQTRQTTRQSFIYSTHNEGSTSLPGYSQHSSSSARSGSSDASTIRAMNSVLPQPVIDRIVRDIGSQWKNLARELKIAEGDIDEIENRYPRNLRESAQECIKIFVKDTDPYKMQHKLLNALDECQRRDLKEQVEEILSRRPL